VTVRFDEFLYLFQIKSILVKLLNYILIYRNWVLAHNNTSIVFDIDNVVPRMLPDIIYLDPGIRISVQDFLHQVLTFSTNELRNLVVSIKDLFVEEVCVWVLKW
jgi:hypothetical protein